MILSWKILKPSLQDLRKKRIQAQQLRNVTALYMTGDKAKENYATIQPFMDYEKINYDREKLENSITQRKLRNKINLKEIASKYEIFKLYKGKIDELEKQREMIVENLRGLAREQDTATKEFEELKMKGKQLRQQQKAFRELFYPIEDEFAHMYLSLPNNLHKNCGTDGKEKILFRHGLPVKKMNCKSHLEYTDLIRFINNDRYYMFKEAASFDIFATQALTRYFVHTGGFTQTANPDFVRCVLLEANATPMKRYHKVMEQNLQNSLNCAYLSGGAAFESFLANVTRLSVFPNVLPLRYVCCGRSYDKSCSSENNSNLFTATQTNAVQTFVATETAQQADEQFEKIVNLTINFYKSLGHHFRIVYVDASELTAAESLRASIEVYSPVEQRYVSVGHISNYGDYVAKRIIFCMRKQKDYHYLHLVGGPILYTTRLLAALIEHGVPLDYSKLPGAYTTDKPKSKNSVLNEFKEIFK